MERIMGNLSKDKNIFGETMFVKDECSSWLYLFVTFLVTFTVVGVADAAGIFVAIFVDYYKETNAKAGWVTSLVLFLAFALSPVVVYIYRRLGFRWCMLISSSCYVFAFLTTPFMPSLNFLFLSYSIPYGIATAFVGTLTITTQRKYFDKYYGFAVGVRYSSNAMGAVVASLILPIIFQAVGVKTTFLSLLSLIPVFLFYDLAYRSDVSAGTDTNASSKRKDPLRRNNIYYELLRDKSFVIYLTSLGVFFLIEFIPMLFMVRYAVTLGYPLRQAKWLLMLRGITTLPTRLIIGRLGDKALKCKKVKLIVQVVYLLFGLLWLLCSFVHSFAMLLLFMAVTGVVEGVFWVTFPLLVVEVTGGYHADEAFGLVCLVVAFSILVGPPAMGWLFDETGDFRYVFYTIFVMSLLAAFILVVSSFVTVEKSVSLKEKAKKREKENALENCELTAEDCKSKVPGLPLVYETTI